MAVKRHLPDTFTIHPFKDLKKVLDKRRREERSKPAKTVRAVPPDDEEIFASAMKDVQEISEFRKMPVYQKDSVCIPDVTAKVQDEMNVLKELIDGQRGFDLSHTQEFVKWVDDSCRRDIIDKLHKGHYAVQDCLDLHGVYLADAESEVGGFIRESVRNGLRCIKIIHGRGLGSPNGPVIKQAVVKWLLSRFRKYIIAFVTARQCDGGLGALYILLK